MPVDIGGGILHKEFQEASIPGKLRLRWTRNYSTSILESAGTPLGLGWANEYFCKLVYQGGSYNFVGPNGTVVDFPSPDQGPEHGELLINFGAFHDLRVVDGKYVVRHWDTQTGVVTHFVFHRRNVGIVCHLAAIEDPSGQGLDMEYDRQSRLVAIRQRLEGRRLLLAYDEAGWVSEVAFQSTSDKRYVVVRYGHSSEGCLVSAADSTGLEDHYEYDGQGRMKREIGKDGSVFSMRYDAKGRCVFVSGLDHYDEKRLRFLDATRFVEVTDSTGAVWRYRCLPSGQVAAETNPLGATKETQYDGFGRVVGIVDELSRTTTYSYDDAGNRDGLVNAMGFSFRLRYNAARLPLALMDPMGGIWEREYDHANRLVATKDALGAKWIYSYDHDGNLTHVINPAGARMTLTFAHGILVSGTDWSGNVSQYLFDDFGRLVKKVDPLGLITCLRYDQRGNLAEFQSPDGLVRKGVYDGVGNLVSFVDTDGRETKYVYGPCRRLLEKIDTDGSSEKFRWSTEPDLLAEIINEKGERYRFVRDEAGDIVEEIGFDGRSTRYRYDETGSCIALINGNGEEVILHRDPLGRLIARILPDGELTAYSFDPLGNMQSATNPHIKLIFERDPVGRLVKEVQGDEWVKSYYNTAGHLIRTETSLGDRFDYAVDNIGRVTQISCAGKTIRMHYDARGLEVDRRFPGGVQLRSVYDPVGRLLEQYLREDSVGSQTVSSSSATSLFFRSYDYDTAGLLKASNDSHWGRKDYQYDSRRRLRSVQSNGKVSEAFDYDLTGNIVKITRPNGHTAFETLEYTQGDRLQRKGSTSYRFDAQGRLVGKDQIAGQERKESWEYRWNAADKLVSVKRPDGEQWDYTYDPWGRRIAKIRNGKVDTRFIWSRRHLIHEVKQNSHTSWIYEQDNFAPMVRIDRPGLAAVICDQLGTPTAFVRDRYDIIRAPRLTAWGEVEGSDPGQRGRYYESAYQKTAWGEVEGSDPGSDACNLRFQGYYFDKESGFHCSLFRYYSPEIGRFIQQDPIGWVGGLNQYAYTLNPINFIDPFGLSTSSDSKKLGDNLRRVGEGPQGDDEAAHHIVMSNSQKGGMPDLRNMMGKFDPPIDINDPKNGIFLPRNAATREANDDTDIRTAHQGEGLHSDAYKEYVFGKLMAGQPPPVTREEFLKRLAEMKEELEQGKTFPCKK
jgi:RHS repeat-associated protein